MKSFFQAFDGPSVEFRYGDTDQDSRKILLVEFPRGTKKRRVAQVSAAIKSSLDRDLEQTELRPRPHVPTPKFIRSWVPSQVDQLSIEEVKGEKRLHLATLWPEPADSRYPRDGSTLWVKERVERAGDEISAQLQKAADEPTAKMLWRLAASVTERAIKRPLARLTHSETSRAKATGPDYR